MRAKKMAIGDSYYDSAQHCWPGGPCGVPDIPDDADLLLEGKVGIGTPDPAVALQVGTFSQRKNIKADNFLDWGHYI